MNILFITPGIENAAFGGPKGSIRNYEALKKYGNVVVYKFKRKSILKSFLSLVEGYYPPLNSYDYNELRKLNDQYEFQLVFFDTSIYGGIVDIFKNSKKVVFCHNCEYDYNDTVRFGKTKSIKKRLYLRAIYKNEAYLLNNVDYRIVFLKRDSERIYKIYGLKTDLIVPLGIKDTALGSIDERRKGDYILLFGAYGSANIEGYQWFIDNVSPYLVCKTVVAGRGFDLFKDSWKSEKVEVFGYVEDMGELYNNAFAVSVPLFSGGGMKVKVVEALMYGKEIYGTDEAFEGFEVNNSPVLHRCNDAKDFINTINQAIKSCSGGYSKISRELYENSYSIQSTINLFDEMIAKLGLSQSVKN